MALHPSELYLKYSGQLIDALVNNDVNVTLFVPEIKWTTKEPLDLSDQVNQVYIKQSILGCIQYSTRNWGFFSGSDFLFDSSVERFTDNFGDLPFHFRENQPSTRPIDFSNACITSDGNVAVLSKKTSRKISDLENELNVEFIPSYIDLDIDFFMNFVSSDVVVYNHAMAEQLGKYDIFFVDDKGKIDEEAYSRILRTLDNTAETLAKKGYHIIEIQRDLNIFRKYSVKHHLPLIGNILTIGDNKVVMLKDFPADYLEFHGSKNVPDELRKQGIDVYEVNLFDSEYKIRDDRFFEMMAGPRCMTLPKRIY